MEDNRRGCESGSGAGDEGETRGDSGQGLALHSTLLDVAGSTLALKTVPGTPRIVLTLPPTAG